MIVEPSQIDSSRLRTQVCIVGAGGAGITLALELGRAGIDVVLIAGGGYRQRAEDEALYRGVIDPKGSHEPLEVPRHRALGGSTKLWGGRLVPYDPIDFERRAFVPLSGWPTKYDEVAGYYPRSMELCEVQPSAFQIEPSATDNDLPASLNGGAIVTTPCERWSPPTDFGVRYRSDLERLLNVRVLMDYHGVDLLLDDGLHAVKCVRAKSRYGPTLDVAAEAFVLAAGGIENARLLLASRGQLPAGVGNDFDMVGRGYMSHLAGTYGYVRLHEQRKPAFYRWHHDADGAYCRRRFQLAESAQRELEVMNIVAFPYRPESNDASHCDAVLSFVHLFEVAAAKVRRQETAPAAIGAHVRNVATASPRAWVDVARQIFLRMRRRRLPYILPFGSRAQDALFFQGEHAPNLESRFVLSDECDEFGMPRISPRVRFSEIDYRTVMEFYRVLDKGLRASGAGYVEYDPAGLAEYLKHLTTNFRSMNHHLGTTRMSDDPHLGVVDRDCRVHSVGNLYVSGGSVFPTASHANPTVTILALTLRLADHLRAKLAWVAMCATQLLEYA